MRRALASLQRKRVHTLSTPSPGQETPGHQLDKQTNRKGRTRTCPSHGPLSRTGANIPGLPHLTEISAPSPCSPHPTLWLPPRLTPTEEPLPLPKAQANSDSQTWRIQGSPHVPNVPATVRPVLFLSLLLSHCTDPLFTPLSPEVWIGLSISRVWALGGGS